MNRHDMYVVHKDFKITSLKMMRKLNACVLLDLSLKRLYHCFQVLHRESLSVF